MARFTTTGGHWSRCRDSDREGRIVYIGTFSRTVFPSMRIGYLIAQASLVPAFTAAKWLSDLHSASLEQQTLADFIAGGMYERHLRRLRRRNTARRAALLEAIANYLGDRVEVTGEGVPSSLIPRCLIVDEGSRKPVGRTPTDRAGELCWNCESARIFKKNSCMWFGVMVNYNTIDAGGRCSRMRTSWK